MANSTHHEKKSALVISVVIALFGVLACSSSDDTRRELQRQADGAVPAANDSGTSSGAEDAGGSDAQTAPASCSDGIRNGDETDVDCGGTTCPVCRDGQACNGDTDCASGICNSGACTAPSCTDGVKNGTETDVDCGGGACSACADGSNCVSATDCTTSFCSGNVCTQPSCADGVKNGTETDIDCGGACPACQTALPCDTFTDCASHVCLNGVCQAPTCTDAVTNGTETDVDCGGSCAGCPAGAQCAGVTDCASRVCINSICQDPLCTDGVTNGTESDIDCGGSICTGCAPGAQCGAPMDCASHVCSSGICQQATCTDAVTNATETDVDCGNGTCAQCSPGAQCAAASDCDSGVCTSGACQAPSCSDGVQNGAETGVDCGNSCGPCPGTPCTDGSGCASGVCENGVCQAPSCPDGVQNGTETGVDCGSSCGSCPGALCSTDSECASRVCKCDVSATPYGTGCWELPSCRAPECDDHVKNGTETDVDCGGPCSGCATGKACETANDCASSLCVTGVCAFGCADGVQNGAESDVDCGGGFCAPCTAGSTCAAAADCVSGVCTNGVCQAPTCSDGVRNGEGDAEETDVDCGGSLCPPCAPDAHCSTRSDCTSKNCIYVAYPDEHTCQWAACSDGVQNAFEADVDCGGVTCSGCAIGRHCKTATDCASGVCTSGSCAASGPTCTDGIRDSGETDVDCGGTCTQCQDGKKCLANADCVNSQCMGGFCGAPPFTPFAYTPSHFDPNDLSIDPTAADATTVLDCGVSEFDSSNLEAYNWCGNALPAPVIQVQSDGTEVAVAALRGLQIAAGSTLRLYGSRPVILAVYGDAAVDGIIDGRPLLRDNDPVPPYDPTYFVERAGVGSHLCSEGPGGGGGSGAPASTVVDVVVGQLSTAQTAPGGAGAGHATTGAPGWLNDNVGWAYGSASTVPVLAGCRGGRGGGIYGPSSGYLQGGAGGLAGGAIQLSASGNLQIAGSVLASGSDGATSYVFEPIWGTDGWNCPLINPMWDPYVIPCYTPMPVGFSGGGGGSGGSVLMEGDTVAVLSTATVDAHGGIGVNAVSSCYSTYDCTWVTADAGFGGDGSAGFVHINAQTCTIAGTTTPTATTSCATGP